MERVWAGYVNISLVNHSWSRLAPSFAGGLRTTKIRWWWRSYLCLSPRESILPSTISYHLCSLLVLC